MSKEIKVGCGASSSKNNKQKQEQTIENDTTMIKEEQRMIRVGKPAPTFTAQAFHEGKFTEVSLEDYKGQWVLLCFYPGDFTFV